MPFINDILRFNSLAIVGLEKNTGKTECLKYVLSRMPLESKRIALTSIGIDGEKVDQVTLTEKPEIVLRPGMLFATSEKHYKQRELVAELLDVSDESTSLGRIVTAKAVTAGKVMLSGPSSNAGLKRWMSGLKRFGVDLAIIDGALSRMSSASPAVSEAMILATGAAYSLDMNTLIRKTAHVVKLINLELTGERNRHQLGETENGLWWIDSEGSLRNLQSTSLMHNISFNDIENCKTLYVAGALVDSFLEKVRMTRKLRGVEIVVRDFTKVFVSPLQLSLFEKSGGRITVLQRSHLIAVTVNPTSPGGYSLNSAEVCRQLSQAINLPVYDIKQQEQHDAI